MRTDNKLIDQSSEISALQVKIFDLKNMISVMQEIIINQNKQITDIHNILFNNTSKDKQITKEDMKKQLKARNLETVT